MVIWLKNKLKKIFKSEKFRNMKFICIIGITIILLFSLGFFITATIMQRFNKAEEVKYIEENGMRKMVQIPNIKIPAKSSVELKPGGLHLMFIGLNEQLNDNSNVDLNLTFSDGKTYELTKIPVKKVIPAKMH